MKSKFTKLLCMCFGLILSAGAYAIDTYTPDLVWRGAAKDSSFNKTSLNWMTTIDSVTALPFTTGKKLLVSYGLPSVVDTVNAVAITRNRRYLLLKENLELGGLVFNSPNAYTMGTTTLPTGEGNVLSGDFQMVQKGTGVVTLVGKGFILNNTQGTLIENNSTLRVNGPGGTANAGNLIAETVFGSKVTFNNGSLMMGSSSNTTSTLLGYEQMKWDIDVLDNRTGAFTFDRYCVWEGKMTGSANTAFNLYIRCIREVFGGDLSNFKGTLTAGVDHSSDAGALTLFTPVAGGPACVAFILADTAGVAEFNLDGTLRNVLRRENYLDQRDTLTYTYATRYPLGMPDGTVNINDSVIMIWGSDLSIRSGGTGMYRDNSICRIGALNGTAASILGSTRQGTGTSNHTWQVGSANTDATFNGQIMNSGFKSRSGLTNNITKVGTGDWRLTNASHSFNGKIWVRQGSLTVLGRMTSNGKLAVDSGAVLKGSPNFTALSGVDINGTLEIGGEASVHGIGNMTFAAGDINVNANAKIRIGLGQGNRCDNIKYAGITTFDPSATIEFFVEEGPVAAGDTFAVMIPISTALSASIVGTCNVVMQNGLVLDVTHLFDDPIWALPSTKYLCGVVKVISNTNPGIYTAQAATVTSVSPVAKSAVGVAGSIKVTYDKNIARGTGAITMGGIAFEPVIATNVATINYTGLVAEADSFDLVIPAGAIKESSNSAATAAYTVRFFHDKIAPTLVSQSIRADSVMTWEDGNITFTFSEGITVANASGITINQTQFEKVKPSVNNSVLTLGTVALNYGKNYTINIAAGALTDNVGNPAPTVSLNFSTANPLTYTDVVGFNTKPYVNLPITFEPIPKDTAVFPLWAHVNAGAGTFADGEMTWTSNNSSNKIMSAFIGTATKFNVTARRTGTDAVGLRIQEAVAESSVSKWRTIKELTNDDLTLTKQTFSFNVSPNIRFVKILPSTASATASITVSGYSVEGIPASLKQTTGSSIRSYMTSNGLALEGLPAGARVEVYDLTGVRKAALVANSSSMIVPVHGFGIVKITSEAGTTVIKALVK